MKRLFGILAIILFFCFSVNARAKYSDYVQVGGKSVKTSSVTAYLLMETFPSATVTVYLAGTTTLATIYSNNTGTIKANPFTADSKAYYEFYADNGFYDIKFSGTGISLAFTKAYIALSDPSDEYNPVSYGAKCDNSTNDVAAFSAIVSLVAGATVTLDLPKGICRTNTITFPTNINVKSRKGGGFYANNSNTVTILGNLDAPPIKTLYNGLAGQGTFFFKATPLNDDGRSNVERAFPQWWGGIGITDGVTDAKPAITAALKSGIRRIFLIAGTYGLASPIYITTTDFILEGQSRVYTDIIPLATNIHIGSDANALFINATGPSTVPPSPTNSIIKHIRFTSLIGFTGWGIWAQEGVQGGKALFSTIIEENWISMGQSSAGFFNGVASDCYFIRNDYENTGIAYKLVGSGIGADHFIDEHILSAVEPYIYCVDNISNHMEVRGLSAATHLQETLIYVTGGIDWTIDGINFDFDPVTGGLSALTEGAIGQFNNCTNLIISRINATRLSGKMSGLLFNNSSQVKVSNVHINDPVAIVAIPQAITISGDNSHTVDISMNHIEIQGGTVQQLGITATIGEVVLNDSILNKSTSSAIVSSMPAGVNITLQGNRIMNANYNGASVVPIIDVKTSGRFDLLNNRIGSDDILSTPTAYLKLTGTGDNLVEGNIFIGNLNLAAGGTTQLIKLGLNYGIATHFYATAMPVSGSWRQGDVVHALLPVQAGVAPNKYIIMGWIRLTTNSNNVLNTDWMEMRTLTGN